MRFTQHFSPTTYTAEQCKNINGFLEWMAEILRKSDSLNLARMFLVYTPLHFVDCPTTLSELQSCWIQSCFPQHWNWASIISFRRHNSTHFEVARHINRTARSLSLSLSLFGGHTYMTSTVVGGGGGHQKADKSDEVEWILYVTNGEGVKKSEHFADVI